MYLWIKGRKYSASRCAWLYMTGAWPVDQVDHIDRDRMNNRWRNLREADNSLNQVNTGLRSDNKTGFKGVYWVEAKGKWRARVGVRGRDVHLGYFNTAEEASAAYFKAARLYFGEFARK
jgi:hypothetical protein